MVSGISGGGAADGGLFLGSLEWQLQGRGTPLGTLRAGFRRLSWKIQIVQLLGEFKDPGRATTWVPCFGQCYFFFF